MYKDKTKKDAIMEDVLSAAHPFALIGFGELLLVNFY
jgi:hypothetical protein